MYAELGLEYIASRGNEYSSKYQFSAYGEKRASLTFWKNWSVGSVVKAEEFDTPAFHDLPAHNSELGVTCVECHHAHERDVDPSAYFLNGAQVRKECARCHSQFED